jgi:hypothetical protein
VLWGAAAFLCGQLALSASLVWGPPALRDPEYGRRLQSFRRRAAERPGRPVVVFLGSSRIATTIRPGLLEANRIDFGPGGAVVFNFGLCQSTPAMELLCLRRLLADGVRPDCVFAELWPGNLGNGPADEFPPLLRPERLDWQDLSYLRPCYARPGDKRRRWLAMQLAPWYAYRGRLLKGLKGGPREWQGVDEWGWLNYDRFRSADGPLWRILRESNRAASAAGAERLVIDPYTQRALDELPAVCRREHVALAWVLMPDLFLPDYPPRARAWIDGAARSVSRDSGTPLIDAQEWAEDGDFVEGVHLTHAGAAAFTRRFERDVLRPYLDGEPLAERWPPGGGNLLQKLRSRDREGAE